MERIARLKAFLMNDPDDSFLKHALALEYIKEGNDVEAQRLFIELLTKEPGYVGSYYHLAKLYERNGDRVKAIDCYQKGMEAATAAGDRHALNELAMAYEDLTDSE